ncbi:hypothetical protein INQ13_22755 [Escherichia coli]|nr:hypothetical protein [Escherichia coli]MBL7589949.1 hypothetical protein [Escherichia coli]
MPPSVPRAPEIRFRVDPIYAPADKIARRMCLTLSQFTACQRRLFARGFPTPDETTGMYDLEAVDRWRKRQRPDLFPELTGGAAPVEVERPRTDWGAVFAEAQKRKRNG